MKPPEELKPFSDDALRHELARRHVMRSALRCDVCRLPSSDPAPADGCHGRHLVAAEALVKEALLFQRAIDAQERRILKR